MYESSVSANHAEHSVTVKPNSKTKLLKLGLIAAAIVLFIGLFVVLSLFDAQVLMLGGSVMLIVLEVFGIWTFWKYTSLEYDYVIATGDLTMSVIYGSRSRKDVFSVKISSVELIASYNGEPAKEENGADNVYRCVSSFDASSIIYMSFKDQQGKNCVAYLEAPQKVLKLLKFYNVSAYKVVA